jgi:hypothetical protein
MVYKRKAGRASYWAAKRSGVTKHFKRACTSAGAKRRMRKSFSLNVHRFSRFSTAGTINMTGTEQPLSFSFALSDILKASEFTTLFDKYHLDKAVVFIQMINNPNAYYKPNEIASNPNNFYPKMWYIRDHDDSSTTTIAALKERVSVKCVVMQPDKVVKICVKPEVAMQVYKTLTTTGYAPKYGQFIDMTYNTVPHYGLKTVF